MGATGNLITVNVDGSYVTGNSNSNTGANAFFCQKNSAKTASTESK